MRNFYSCSVGEKDKGYDDENLKRIIGRKAFILNENTPQKGDYYNIKKGDIIILKYRGNFIAYGEAIRIEQSDDDEWNLFVPVENWCFHDASSPTLGITIYGMKEATLAGSQYGTVKPLEANFSVDKIKMINKDTPLYKIIKSELNLLKETNNMQDKIDILNYKKQIILQGPPGTGKTRLAKMLAYEFTKSEVKLSPFEYIDWYIKNFKSSKTTTERNLSHTDLLKEFTDAFPPEIIRKMSMDQYCLGKGSTTSFCYWIEVGLKGVGRFSPGPAGTTVYGVYYSQEDQEYKSVSKTPEELMNDIQIALFELVDREDYTKARELFRFSFILKILNSYFPEKYFSVVSHQHLKSIASILNIDLTNLNDIEINKEINEVVLKLKTQYASDISSLDLMGHLYNKFNIKENKFDEVQIDVVDVLGETKLIQFHPAYTYEDFVRGIVAETNQNSQIEYKVVNKVLADFAQTALEDPTNNYVLIIDEINRANLPSVLGELIYALEYRYNEEEQNIKEATVESMYTLKPNEKDLEGDNTLLLPTNFFIIGTMNTADRSVGHIDYAIRRRFAFVDVLPKSLVEDDEIYFNTEGFDTIAKLFNEANVSSEFDVNDIQIGHSYFIAKKSEAKNESERDAIFKMKMEYEIVPILEEYVKDGILIGKVGDLSIKEYVKSLK